MIKLMKLMKQYLIQKQELGQVKVHGVNALHMGERSRLCLFTLSHRLDCIHF